LREKASKSWSGEKKKQGEREDPWILHAEAGDKEGKI